MRRDEKLALAGAVLVALFGLVMIAGVLIGFFEKTSNYSPTTDALLSLLFGVLPLVVGVYLIWRIRGGVVGRRQAEREAAVLGVVKEHEGTVTAVDVAADCGMSLEQAEQTLGQLHRRGFSEMDVTDAGTVVYRFRL